MSGPAFRFRAQAALDLRRREDEEARRVLARADADLHTAKHALQAALQRAAAARAECAAVMRDPAGRARLEWYRSWILRLDRECARLAGALAEQEAARARAAAARAATRRRLESLERLRERAHRSWMEVTTREDRKRLDELATLRFVFRER